VEFSAEFRRQLTVITTISGFVLDNSKWRGGAVSARSIAAAQ
jgi:hypothetical protein